MSRLALGTAQFGLTYGVANKIGKPNSLEVNNILTFALQHGIKVIDTAINYGNSESVLGQNKIHDFDIITKLPGLPEDCLNIDLWVQRQVSSSFSRLGVKSIYGLLLHKPEQLLSSKGKQLFRALEKLKEEKKVYKIGISVYSPFELEALLKNYVFDIVQAPFNLVDQRLYKTGWMQKIKDRGIELHTRSVFLQGLLLMRKENIPFKFSIWNDLWQNWDNWLLDRDVTAIQACLSFPLSFIEIDRIIVGVDNLSQLTELRKIEANRLLTNFPNLGCDDDNLINPSKWFML